MILLSLAAICLIGISLLLFLFPRPIRWSLETLVLLSLGVGLGIGVASSLFFICLVASGPNFATAASVEGAALILTLLLAYVVRKRAEQPSAQGFGWAAGPVTPAYLTWFFLGAAGLAAVIFVIYSVFKPHGDFDAWVIWNLRARFLVRGGSSWAQAFSSRIAWSHPDYPLLFPGAVALVWTLAHTESTLAPIGISFLFTLAAAALLISALGMLRGKSIAWLAGIVLLGTVTFAENGAMQYADVPLSFFILATLVLLCLQDLHPTDPRYGILAGLMAGFAAWTKNEGLMFLIAVFAARGISILRAGKSPGLSRQIASLFVGFAPLLAIIGFFKLRYAPPNDLITQAPGQVLGDLADPGRWITVLVGLVKGVLLFGSFLIPLALVLALYWYLVRFHVDEPHRLAVATGTITLVLMLAGELIFDILFPPNIAVQIDNSIGRILLETLPAALFVFFLASKSPELIVEKAKPKSHAKQRPKSA